ncbi:hypothetical protein DRQ18_00870 [bacterium]|nr:MAG: hypothetical protein DRQ18_00870 [bacterium]
MESRILPLHRNKEPIRGISKRCTGTWSCIPWSGSPLWNTHGNKGKEGGMNPSAWATLIFGLLIIFGGLGYCIFRALRH